jgi:hypothetical protein
LKALVTLHANNFTGSGLSQSMLDNFLIYSFPQNIFMIEALLRYKQLKSLQTVNVGFTKVSAEINPEFRAL